MLAHNGIVTLFAVFANFSLLSFVCVRFFFFILFRGENEQNGFRKFEQTGILHAMSAHGQLFF